MDPQPTKTSHPEYKSKAICANSFLSVIPVMTGQSLWLCRKTKLCNALIDTVYAAKYRNRVVCHCRDYNGCHPLTCVKLFAEFPSLPVTDRGLELIPRFIYNIRSYVCFYRRCCTNNKRRKKITWIASMYSMCHNEFPLDAYGTEQNFLLVEFRNCSSFAFLGRVG